MTEPCLERTLNKWGYCMCYGLVISSHMLRRKCQLSCGKVLFFWQYGFEITGSDSNSVKQMTFIYIEIFNDKELLES